MAESTSRPLPSVAASLALSIVIPVYNGADSIGELVGALEELDIEGGHRGGARQRRQPRQQRAVCRSPCRAGADTDHAG